MHPDPEVCGELLAPLRTLLGLKQFALHELTGDGDLPSYAAAGLLGELVTGGEARACELAHHRVVDASVISRQLAQLEQAGLVSRRPAPHDRRVSLLSATAAGERAFADLERRKREWLSHALRDWDTAEVRHLTGQLASVSRDLRKAARDLIGQRDHPRTEGAE